MVHFKIHSISFRRCIYNMLVPAGRQLNVEILAMDMDCPYDYVALTTDNSPNVLTLCPPTVVQPSELTIAYVYLRIIAFCLRPQAKVLGIS